jgi:hypothetical protein
VANHLAVAGDFMMTLASVDIIAETWRALNSPVVVCRPSVAAQLAAKFLDQGWAEICDVQDMVWALEGRFTDQKIGDLIRALNIPMRPIYQRPSHGAERCIGQESLTVADVAWLLILMERLGFELDPMILVRPVAQRLKKSKCLNDAELTALWYEKEHLKNAPVALFTHATAVGTSCETLTTRTKYRIEFWKGLDGAPMTLQAFAPRYRPNRAH